MKAFFALILLFSSPDAFAENRPLLAARKTTRSPAASAPISPSAAAPFSPVAQASQAAFPVNEGITRILINADYNSWFEKLTVNQQGGQKQESQALYYGYGINVEKNWFHPTWGWGVGGGLLSGRALGGDTAGSLQYFEPRVPWYAARGTLRAFYRWNPQTDFGLDLVGVYKHATWPSNKSGAEVKSGSDILAGAFVDVRMRFNRRLEAIQSFGVLYKDESIYWRLGLGYLL